MAVYAYIRKGVPCSVIDQLKLVQEFSCEGIYVEEADFREDLELQNLMESLVPGEDTIVIANLQVLGKSMQQIAEIFQQLHEKQVFFVSIEDGIDSQNTLMSLYEMMAIFRKNDEFYRARHLPELSFVERNGLKCGRPKVPESKVEQMLYLRIEKGYPMRKISKACEVSVGTVYKYLKAYHVS